MNKKWHPARRLMKLSNSIKPIMVRLEIGINHHSGLDPYKEVEIPLKLAKKLYDVQRIHWDVTNKMYFCWAEQYKHSWTLGID